MNKSRKLPIMAGCVLAATLLAVTIGSRFLPGSAAVFQGSGPLKWGLIGLAIVTTALIAWRIGTLAGLTLPAPFAGVRRTAPTSRTQARMQSGYEYSPKPVSQHNAYIPLRDRTIVLAFVGMLVTKALITFLLLPALTHYLGDDYHSDLFPDNYDLIAQNIVQGNGYRVYADTSETMLRSPGFVLILAAIFALAGKSLLAVQVVQYFMSAASAILIYLISQRLFATRQVSLLAAAIYLFHPVSIMSDTRAGNDTTLTLCLTITIWLLLRAIDSSRPRDFALTGLVLGYTMLVKASVALIFPVVFLFLIWPPIERVQFWALVRNFLVTAVVAAMVMAPWVVRNFHISGKFVPTMTVAGLVVFQGEEAERHSGNGEDSWRLLDDAGKEQIRIGHEMGLSMREDFFPQFYRVGDEIAYYNELGRRGWAEYEKDPMLLMRAIMHNSWAFWFEGRTRNATRLNIVIMLPFILLAAYGAMLAVHRERKNWILVIAIITFVLPHLMIIAVARYSATIIPLMCIQMACVLFSPWGRWCMDRMFGGGMGCDGRPVPVLIRDAQRAIQGQHQILPPGPEAEVQADQLASL
jgi:4-amino-4-deoxy-L-arabinose transferase-like glycosyltransferase